MTAPTNCLKCSDASIRHEPGFSLSVVYCVFGARFVKVGTKYIKPRIKCPRR